MDQTSKQLLTSVLSLPTMSFHEVAVSTFVKWYAMGLGMGIKEDRAGNILVSHGKGAGVTFAAHMDHPGFEVISAKGKGAKVALWGKVDPRTFAGSKVVVYTADGPAKGRIGKKALKEMRLGRHCFDLKCAASVSKGDFGHYDIPAVRFGGGRITTRAADNLVSVAAILDLMSRLARSGKKASVSGLFTRGEEAGFLGAFAAMDSGLIPKGDPLVVLECSSAGAGNVAIGKGPVIRAGDGQSTFDPAVEVWLSNVAAGLSKTPGFRLTACRNDNRSSGFKFQRSLLQGGRCEACVYIAEGYLTGGIAMPLGNYHNQGPRGYAAEYVSIDDYDNLLSLIMAVVKNPMPGNVLKDKVAPIRAHYGKLKGKFFGSG